MKDNIKAEINVLFNKETITSSKQGLKLTYSKILEYFQNILEDDEFDYMYKYHFEYLLKNGLDMDFLIKEFSTIFKARNIKDTCIVFVNFFFTYIEPTRTYHNLIHIQTLLKSFNTFKNVFEKKYGLNKDSEIVIKMAIIFHDYVYKIGATDNEYYSAILAKNTLYELGFNKSIVINVENCILATWFSNKNYTPKNILEQIVTDLDLLGFSFMFQDYLKNTINVIAESNNLPISTLKDLTTLFDISLKDVNTDITPKFYESFVNKSMNKELIEKRINFLHSLLEKEWIYSLYYFRFNNHHIAKANILEELKLLTRIKDSIVNSMC